MLLSSELIVVLVIERVTWILLFCSYAIPFHLVILALYIIVLSYPNRLFYTFS